MRTWKIIALIASFWGMVAVLTVLSFQATRLDRVEKGNAVRQGVNRRTEIEMLEVPLHGVPGVMGVRCGLVRRDKLQRGVFSFGAFETLELRGLEIVLPSVGELGDERMGGGREDSDEIDVLTAVNLPMKPFSEISPKNGLVDVRIDGFSLSRLVAGKVEPLITAESGRMRRKALRLDRCCVRGIPWTKAELGYRKKVGFFLRGMSEGRNRELVIPCVM